jgi:hypothetical protein
MVMPWYRLEQDGCFRACLEDPTGKTNARGLKRDQQRSVPVASSPHRGSEQVQLDAPPTRFVGHVTYRPKAGWTPRQYLPYGEQGWLAAQYGLGPIVADQAPGRLVLSRGRGPRLDGGERVCSS